MPSPARVLIVDDDRFLNRSMQAFLEKHGFTVDCAFDGHEALRKAVAQAPAVVLLDVMLPGENGYRVSRLLKSLPKLSRRAVSPKVVLITARRLDEDPAREELFQRFSMADAVLYKPFELRSLLEQVNTILGALPTSGRRSRE